MALGDLPTGDEKRVRVQEMFDRIAPRYDALNRVISAGLDQRWRKRSLDKIGVGVNLPEIVAEVRTLFGERAATGLAAAVVAGQFYPLLKRGMGHNAACEPVLTRLLAGDATKRAEATG